MRIGRTLPPAAAPISLGNILSGFAGLIAGEKEVTRFQQELASYHKVKHCFLLSSGKAALTVTLLALKKLSPDRDEVLIPAYTCYSVPAAIVRAGLKIRLCDTDPQTLDFDYEELKDHLAVSQRILCVIPTHLFGIMADVQRVRALIGNNLPFVLEDAAQAMGESAGLDKAGALGDAGIISLGRGKAFSTVEGGVILTNNESIASEIQRGIDFVPSYGIVSQIKLVLYALAITLLSKPWLFWIPRSLPFLRLGETIYSLSYPVVKLAPFQAGLARGWQMRIAALQDLRKMRISQYMSAGIDCPSILKAKEGAYIRFPAYVDRNRRETILEKSSQSGSGLAIVYPSTVANIPEIREHLVGGKSGNAALLSEKLVSLPVHAFVKEFDIKKIISLLNSMTETRS